MARDLPCAISRPPSLKISSLVTMGWPGRAGSWPASGRRICIWGRREIERRLLMPEHAPKVAHAVSLARCNSSTWSFSCGVEY